MTQPAYLHFTQYMIDHNFIVHAYPDNQFREFITDAAHLKRWAEKHPHFTLTVETPDRYIGTTTVKTQSEPADTLEYDVNVEEFGEWYKYYSYSQDLPGEPSPPSLQDLVAEVRKLERYITGVTARRANVANVLGWEGNRILKKCFEIASKNS